MVEYKCSIIFIIATNNTFSSFIFYCPFFSLFHQKSYFSAIIPSISINRTNEPRRTCTPNNEIKSFALYYLSYRPLYLGFLKATVFVLKCFIPIAFIVKPFKITKSISFNSFLPRPNNFTAIWTSFQNLLLFF